jgi:hypothetical protein
MHTLANVIIVDPTQVDLVSWATLSCEVIATLTAQMKKGLYYNCYCRCCLHHHNHFDKLCVQQDASYMCKFARKNGDGKEH